MKISIVSGRGEATTLLSAFDAALKDCGVCNYNLIPLSSIIPPHSQIIQIKKYETPEAEFGHRLYVVKAEMRSSESGKFIAAGVGWYQLKDGRGLFVEHEMIGDTKVAVISEMEFRIKNSLKDLCQFRDIPFDSKNVKAQVAISKVKDHPACVLALAVFKAEGWD